MKDGKIMHAVVYGVTSLTEHEASPDVKSIWSKFLAEKDDGIHHIALGVSNYDELVETHQTRGNPMLVAAVFQGCR